MIKLKSYFAIVFACKASAGNRAGLPAPEVWILFCNLKLLPHDLDTLWDVFPPMVRVRQLLQTWNLKQGFFENKGFGRSCF